MDHNAKHFTDASLILADLSLAKTALDLLLKTGKAGQISEDELKLHLDLPYEINGASLSYRLMYRMIHEARRAREFSYAPYSHFNVGAAIWVGDNDGMRGIVAGPNVENASYGLTICAERTAAFKAVGGGFRKFYAYCVVGGFDDSTSQELRDAAANDYITPCGACRQVTKEFEIDPCPVIVAKDTGGILVTTLEFLLPAGFGPKSLGTDAASYDRHALK